MPKPKLSDKNLQEVHKLVFLAGEFPNKQMSELGTLFGMSMFDINAAVWRAKDLGLFYVDDKTGFYKVEKEPETWDFGPEVQELMDTVMYVFEKLAEGEHDMEETNFGQWAEGHLTHNVLVTIKKLLKDGKLVSYELTTSNTKEPSKKGLKRGKEPKVIESTYTFYTLPENLEKQWGRKRFPDQSMLKEKEASNEENSDQPEPERQDRP